MKSLEKNFFYNIGYQVLVIILPLITAPYVSRVLGVSGIGTYSYVYSIAYYFGVLGMLGVSNHGNRTIALSKKNKEKMSFKFWNIYIVQFGFSTLMLIIYLIFIIFFFNGNKLIGIIDSLFVLAYVFDITWFFFGIEEFKVTVIRNTIMKIMTVLCVFIFVKSESDVWKYALIMGLGTLASQLYLWFIIRRHIVLAKPKLSEIKQQIKPIVLLFIPVLAYSIYKIMDKIMLGAFSNVYEVGIYENSDKIVGIPTSIITAFGTVMMPRISTLLTNKDFKTIKKYNKMSFKYFSIIAIGMTAGLIGISNNLAPLYFGEEFQECSIIISGLSISLIFLTWANIIRTQYLIPRKIDNPYIISTIVGAIVNAIVNLILIGKIGAKGAMIGTVVAEFFVFFVQAFLVRKSFPIVDMLKINIVCIPIGVVMSILVNNIGRIFGCNIKSLIMQIITGIIIYLVLIFIFLFIKKDEILDIIKEKLRKCRDRKNVFR